MGARAIIVIVGTDDCQYPNILRDLRAVGTDGLTYRSNIGLGGDLPTTLHCHDGPDAMAIDAFIAEQGDPGSDICLVVAVDDSHGDSFPVLGAEIVSGPENAAEFEASWAMLQRALPAEASAD